MLSGCNVTVQGNCSWIYSFKKSFTHNLIVPQVIIQTQTAWTDFSLDTSKVAHGNYAQLTGPVIKFPAVEMLDDETYLVCGMLKNTANNPEQIACYDYHIPTKTSTQREDMNNGRCMFAMTKFGDLSNNIFASGGKKTCCTKVDLVLRFTNSRAIPRWGEAIHRYNRGLRPSSRYLDA